MKRFLSALCLLVLATGTLRVAAQVNPYKDGTPGVPAIVLRFLPK